MNNHNNNSVQITPSHSISNLSIKDIEEQHIVRNTQDKVSSIYNQQGESSRIRVQLNRLFL